MNKEEEINPDDYFNWPRSSHNDTKLSLIYRLKNRFTKSKIISHHGRKSFFFLFLTLPLSGVAKNENKVDLYVDYRSEIQDFNEAGESSRMFFDLYVPEMCLEDIEFELEVHGQNISIQTYGIKNRNATKNCDDMINIYEEEKIVVFANPGKYRVFINNEIQKNRIYIK